MVERVNAVTYVLKTQFGLPREELQKEAARLFGVQRLTERLSETMSEAIDEAIRSHRASVQGEQISLSGK